MASRHHRSAHLISYAALAFAWRGTLTRTPTWILVIAVIAFGFLQEGVEVVTHAHPYELSDAMLDAVGALVGAVGARVALRILGN